ncbi:GTP-binding protein [Kluyveromyces marxianus]|uniref:GTP-binding protein n=1 Tax=Kluyveromyces marxianus TaxID=4911 RepID=A0ABX6EX20_KLUMA|nr:GTP-binding protein [Kluyveromyces marxianus]
MQGEDYGYDYDYLFKSMFNTFSFKLLNMNWIKRG